MKYETLRICRRYALRRIELRRDHVPQAVHVESDARLFQRDNFDMSLTHSLLQSPKLDYAVLVSSES